MTFDVAGRSPTFEHRRASSDAEPATTATRAQDAESFARRLEQDIRSVGQSLAAVQREPREGGEELRRRLRIATYMRGQAEAFVAEAAPPVRDRLRAAFGTLDAQQAVAQTLIGWVPRTINAQAGPAAERLDVPLDAVGYFSLYERTFLDAIRGRFTAATLPLPHPRLVWTTSSSQLADLFQPALEAEVGMWELGKKLPSLLYPIDPLDVIDRHRNLDAGLPGETVDGERPRGRADGGVMAARALANRGGGHAPQIAAADGTPVRRGG